VATFDMREYARRGAEARLAELRAESEAIYRAFPDLARAKTDGMPRRRRSTSVSQSAETAMPAVARKRSRSRMSPAQRKAVSLRMKKYWAERRKTNR
jgi:hypothetical protein